MNRVEKGRVRSRTKYAILTGRIQRAPCIGCGDPKAEAHHEDYTNPFAVTWLCHPCHRERHGLPREKPARRRQPPLPPAEYSSQPRGFMTVKEAAAILGLSVVGVQRRLQTKKMAGEKIGRDWLIPETEIERWKERGRLRRPPRPAAAPEG